MMSVFLHYERTLKISENVPMPPQLDWGKNSGTTLFERPCYEYLSNGVVEMWK